MFEHVWQQLPSLGVSGLLFVMWWYERQERVRGAQTTQDIVRRTGQVLEINDHLLDVIRSNTEACIALREEFRAHRETETEWMNRLSRQLDSLEYA